MKDKYKWCKIPAIHSKQKISTSPFLIKSNAVVVIWNEVFKFDDLKLTTKAVSEEGNLWTKKRTSFKLLIAETILLKSYPATHHSLDF